MLKFLVHSTTLVRCDSDQLVSGSSLYPKAKFSFSSDWDALEKVVQFTRLGDEVTISVTLPADGILSVPAEMVTEPGEFTLAVQGRDNSGAVIANTPLLEPTIEVVENGIRDGAAPGMPTPDLYARFVSQLEENNQTVQEILEKAESGEFIGPIGPQGEPGMDGFSPVVAISAIAGGHRITITDASGDHVYDVMTSTESDSGWIQPNGSGMNTRYRSVGNRVSVALEVGSGAYLSGDNAITLFTLPEGYRPVGDRYFVGHSKYNDDELPVLFHVSASTGVVTVQKAPWSTATVTFHQVQYCEFSFLTN